MSTNEIFALALGFFALIVGALFFVYQESRKLASEVQEDITKTSNVVLKAQATTPEQVAELVGAVHRSFRGASCLFNLTALALFQLGLTIVIRYLAGFSSGHSGGGPSEVVKFLEFLSWGNFLFCLVVTFRVFRARRPDLFDRTGWI